MRSRRRAAAASSSGARRSRGEGKSRREPEKRSAQDSPCPCGEPVTSVDAVVTGAGGFIGGHLVRALLADGQSVRGVDIKPLDEWHQVHDDAQNSVGDVSLL